MITKNLYKVMYTPNILLTVEEVTAKSKLFIQYIKLTNEDLTDYFFGIADNWDLNIWTDDNSNLHACLYAKDEDGHYTEEEERLF